MPAQLKAVFARLRGLLQEHGAGLVVASDTAKRYGLEAPIGPATLRSWGGKVRSKTIPVAWVELGKTYVSYHLMGVAGNDKIKIAEPLRARMQGKACFNFKAAEDAVFVELSRVTQESIYGLRSAGYVENDPPKP
jgi:hypothetical protein